MIRKIKSLKLSGVDGYPTLIECEILKGLGIHLVGIFSDSSVKETLLRTVTALNSLAYHIPGQKIVINISPAEVYKSGTGYDLPIALALIAVSGQDGGRLSSLEDWLVVGELGLDATVRPVPGCIQAVETGIAGKCKGVIIPKRNGPEVADLFTAEDIPVYGVGTLEEAISVIAGEGRVPAVWDSPEAGRDITRRAEPSAWESLGGNPSERRALEVAASGGHHLLLLESGDGSGMLLSEALRDILPPMTRAEALSVARTYSASDLGEHRAAVGVRSRPVRAPHHSLSIAGFLGGGCGGAITPGEVSLASEGVLYLDDFNETPKSVREGLRGPIEDGKVVISRLRSKVEMPARFQLVAAFRPCPCGHYGNGDRCTSSEYQRMKYLQGIWGPVCDHADMQLFVHKTDPSVTPASLPVEQGADATAERVKKARDIQYARLGEGRLNASLDSKEIAMHCKFDDETGKILEKLISRLQLSFRSYSNILKVARTIADMDGREDIIPADIMEAASYRFLDRYGNETAEQVKAS